jgi:hypothetical protein
MSAFAPSPPTAGPPGAGPPGAGIGDADPLAALMAPPQRRMPTSYSAPNISDGDPLAALMAPPSMRYSMPPASVASTASLPPAINVWKPPVLPAAAFAPVAAPVMPPQPEETTAVPQSGTETTFGADGPPPS